MHKDYKVWWDDVNKIVRSNSVGILDEKAIKTAMDVGEKLAKEHNSPYVLTDTRRFTKMTADGQKAYSEGLQRSIMKKAAYIVDKRSRIVEAVNIIAMRAKGIKLASKCFTSEQEAVDWLKEDRDEI